MMVKNILTLFLFVCLNLSVGFAEELISSGRTDLSKKDQIRVKKITRLATQFTTAEKFEAMAAGAGTSTKTINRDAFSHHLANLTFRQQRDFKLGNALFRKLWVSSPSSTQASDGLGPLFNARACQSCHLKDGRGHPPESDTDATSMFLRLARDARTEEERKALEDYTALNFPDDNYGGQLQDLAVPALQAEGKMQITYKERVETFSDGGTVSLRVPTYSVADLAFGSLGKTTTLSPRVTPQMIGLGLLQAIHDHDILAKADADDADNDGISGRIAYVRDTQSGQLKIGRFGWKGQNWNIRNQTSGAFSGDIGISTPDVPNAFGDCTDLQKKCLRMPSGVQPRFGKTEAPDPVLGLVTFYSENLSVPARRDVNTASVLRGKKYFYKSGCANCHTPKFVTSRNAENSAHAFQLIWPYTDLLLHDMGEGLADGQRVGAANGAEWRTPPLWGIGLTKLVNGHTFFLHDGRARNLTEAIMWHGGEADTARNHFAALNEFSRNDLISFLESL